LEKEDTIMLWDANYVGEKFEVTVQWLIDTLKDILSKIFNFIGEEEGWTEEETTVA
jgi:hypothetical protein